MLVLQEKSEKAKANSSKNVHTHHMGKGGYYALKKTLAKLGNRLKLVNGATGEEVDTTDMSERTRNWLVGHSRRDPEDKNRFVVEGMAVDVLNHTVYEFYILFQS